MVVPGLSLDPEVLATIGAARHYEERMLSMLMLLRMPRTPVVFLTSTPLAPSIMDYYLHLLSGVPTAHCAIALDAAFGERRVGQPDREAARAAAFAPGGFVRRSAIPHRRICRCSMRRIWGATGSRARHPALWMRSGTRILGDEERRPHCVRRAGVMAPEGRENLRDLSDVADALTDLRRRDPRFAPRS